MPPIGSRSNRYDSVLWKDMEVMEYHLEIGDNTIVYRIDTWTEKITSISGSWLEFSCYFPEGRETFLGESCLVRWELHNVQEVPLDFSLNTRMDEEFSAQLVEPREFHPGEIWQYEQRIPMDTAGIRQIESTLGIYVPHTGQHMVFRITGGVRVVPKVRLHIDREDYAVYAGKEFPLSVAVTNDTADTVVGSLQAAKTEQLTIGGFGEQIVLAAGESKRIRATALLTHGHVKTPVRFLENAGTEAGRCSLELRAYAEQNCVADVTETSAVLENPHLKVTVDLATGTLQIYEKSTHRLVLTEAWPDSSKPYISGIKVPRRRKIQGDAKPAGELILWDRSQDRPGVKRHLVLKGHILKAANFLVNDAQEASTATVAKIHPWVELESPDLILPAGRGIMREPVIDDVFPFGLHDNEHVNLREFDIRSTADNGSWSAFTEENITVGMVWTGAGEVRFGLKWLPALVYEAGALQPGAMTALPEYYIFAGPGGHQNVVDLAKTVLSGWSGLEQEKPTRCIHLDEANSGAVAMIDGGAVPLRLAVRSHRLLPRAGTVKVNLPPSWDAADAIKKTPAQFPDDAITLDISSEHDEDIQLTVRTSVDELGVYCVPVQYQDSLWRHQWDAPIWIAGNCSDSVTITEKSRHNHTAYEVDNGCLRYQVIPGFGGTITELHAFGHNWLSSSFPKAKTFGPALQWHGGIKSSILLGRTKPYQNLSQEETPYSFIACPYIFPMNQSSWKGIQLEGKTETVPFHEVTSQIRYITLPGSNVIVVEGYYKNNAALSVKFDHLTAIHPNLGSNRNPLSFAALKDNALNYYKVTPERAVYHGDSFALLGDEKGSRYCSIVLPADIKGCVYGIQWPEGIHLAAAAQISLLPGEEKTFCMYIAFSRSLQQAGAYRNLARWHSEFMRNIGG